MSAQYTRVEERIHSSLHAAAALAMVIGTAGLVVIAVEQGDVWRIFGGALFGAAATLLFAASALYHGTQLDGRKILFRRFDHSAIYVLIASTYTAFIVSVLREPWGWALLAGMWIAVALGVAAEFGHRVYRPIRSSALYIGMGWIGVLAIKPLTANLTATQLGWVIAGGVAYTAGVPFYVWKSARYTHVLWHFFVVAGVACHFVALSSVMRGGGASN